MDYSSVFAGKCFGGIHYGMVCGSHILYCGPISADCSVVPILSQKRVNKSQKIGVDTHGGIPEAATSLAETGRTRHETGKSCKNQGAV